MLSENRNLIKRRLIFALLILAAFLFQSTPGIALAPFGIRSFPLIALTVCIAMFERETWGAFAGLLAGALWDCVAARGQGFHAIFLMLAGFLCGFLVRYIMRNNLMAALVLTAAFSLLHEVLFWLFFIVIGGVPGAGKLLWRFYLPCAAAAVLWLPLFYFAVRSIMKALRRRGGADEEEEEE